jgi:predicted CXXCH cytochrome family protein
MLLGAFTVLAQQRQDAFRHQRHEGLFPLCAGCHVMDGPREAWYPATALCARCHDGQQEERVTWAGPTREPGNLRFDHASHQRAAAREQQTLDCAACHSAAGGTGRMNVAEAEPATCFGCHTHQATNHLSDAPCAECHVPLAESTLTTESVAALPEPPDHEREDFLLHHAPSGEALNCEFCHVREQCAACHVNARSVPAITRLPASPASLRLPPIEAHHPRPESHERADFATNHGNVAKTESCATCHTRESCMNCHTGRLPDEVAALTPASQSSTQGVTIQRAVPITHAAPGFVTDHGNLAATDPAECSTCHTRQSCEQCHDSPDRAAFHPPDFMLSHSAAAYTGRLECSNCHDPRIFCRDCHAQGGQTSSGRLASSVFHDAEPLWLLRHGGAARRGLEACASCHTQRDCLQCHSTLGAFKVSPHTRDFDARRAQQRNPIICKACHIGDPIR